MRLGWTIGKYSTTYRAVKTIRVDGKNKTLIVKNFGSDKQISKTYGVADAKAWEIEECFRIMKSEFQARPVYLKRKERIVAHFITCFIALILYRYLEKKLDNCYTCSQIIDTLQEMNFIKHEGKGYQPTYTRTELTDALHEAFGFCTSKQIVPIKRMKNICAETKK